MKIINNSFSCTVFIVSTIVLVMISFGLLDLEDNKMFDFSEETSNEESDFNIDDCLHSDSDVLSSDVEYDSDFVDD